jgi:hypothetical protein
MEPQKPLLTDGGPSNTNIFLLKYTECEWNTYFINTAFSNTPRRDKTYPALSTIKITHNENFNNSSVKLTSVDSFSYYLIINVINKVNYFFGRQYQKFLALWIYIRLRVNLAYLASIR